MLVLDDKLDHARVELLEQAAVLTQPLIPVSPDVVLGNVPPEDLPQGTSREIDTEALGVGDAPISYILIVSFCFMLLFTSFLTIQNLLTSVLGGTISFQSLATLYFSFAAGNLVSAGIVARVSLRAALMGGALTYLIWAGTVTMAAYDVVKPLIFLGSVLVGFGGATLWVAQASYVATLTTTEKIGRIQGLFFLIFGTSPLLGQVLVLLLTRVASVEEKVVFAIMTALAGVAVAAFILVQPVRTPLKPLTSILSATVAALVPQAAEIPAKRFGSQAFPSAARRRRHRRYSISEDDAEGDGGNGKGAAGGGASAAQGQRMGDSTTLQSIKAVLKLVRVRPMPRILPFPASFGLAQAFFYGSVTARMSLNLTVQALMLGGGGALIGGFVAGRLSDVISRRLVVLMTLGCVVGGTVLSLVAIEMGGVAPGTTEEELEIDDPSTPASDAMFMVAFLLNGLSEGGFNTQTRAVMAVMFPDSKDAQALNMLALAVSIATGFLYGPELSPTVQGVLLLAMCAVTALLTATLNLNPARIRAFPIRSRRLPTRHRRNLRNVRNAARMLERLEAVHRQRKASVGGGEIEELEAGAAAGGLEMGLGEAEDTESGQLRKRRFLRFARRGSGEGGGAGAGRDRDGSAGSTGSGKRPPADAGEAVFSLPPEARRVIPGPRVRRRRSKGKDSKGEGVGGAVGLGEDPLATERVEGLEVVGARREDEV